jgi:type VII secretion-associated serine protease mycosin
VFKGHCRPPLSLCVLLLACLLSAPIAVVLAISVDDPFAVDQWGWSRVKADQAYDTGYHGEGVIVALLDTGVDTEHPDLAANIIDGWNFVDDNNNITDLDGHGTMVCGVVAAVANNGIGVAGVAPNVTIMPLKVLSESGGNLFDLSLAITYAADHEAKVIGMSLGGNSSRIPMALESAINYAYQKGCVLVAAAGNDGTNELFYPAAYDNVIAVSAIDENDTKASFSNYGDYIDFCAPGVDILTTWTNGTYAYGSGTSFAAPFVTGVVALMLSKYPSLNPENVTATLRAQAEDLGDAGWDQFYGWGLVDAYAAVTQTSIPEVSTAVFFITITSTTLLIPVINKIREPRKTKEHGNPATRP